MKKVIVLVANNQLHGMKLTPITIKTGNRASCNSVKVDTVVNRHFPELYSYDTVFPGKKFVATISNRSFPGCKHVKLSEFYLHQYSYVTDDAGTESKFICGKWLNRIFGKQVRIGQNIYFNLVPVKP